MKLDKLRPSPATVIALVALFVALGGVGVAATGGNFILGQSNTADKTTSLASGITSGPTLQVTNSAGKPAARFVTDTGAAPFSVDRPTRIPNLNADKLDGLDSTGFVLGTGRVYAGHTTAPDGTSTVKWIEIPELGKFELDCYRNATSTQALVDFRAAVDGLRLYVQQNADPALEFDANAGGLVYDDSMWTSSLARTTWQILSTTNPLKIATATLFTRVVGPRKCEYQGTVLMQKP